MARLFFAIILGAALAASPIFAHAAEPLRPVAMQSSDSSCGAAALANLLTWAGYPVTEAQLDAIMREHVLANDPTAVAVYRDQGASRTELVRLVAALDAGFELKAEIVSLDAARSLASREAYIAFLIDAAAGGQMLSHFTIVAGFDPARGWLRADSIDGSHIWQKDTDFKQAALVQRDQTRVLVLRLVRNGRTAVASEDAIGLADAQVPWIATSRLLTGNARTRSPVVSLSIGQSRTSFNADGILLKERGQFVVAGLSYPLTKNLVGSISVPYRSGSTSIGIPGVFDFDLGKTTGVGPIGLRLVRQFDGADAGTNWFSGSLDIEPNGLPVGFRLTAGINREVGSKTVFSASTGIGAQRGDGRWDWSALPSMSLIRMIGSSSSVSADASAIVPLRDGKPSISVGLGVDRQISKDIGIGISASWVIVGPSGYRSRTLGINFVKRL